MTKSPLLGKANTVIEANQYQEREAVTRTGAADTGLRWKTGERRGKSLADLMADVVKARGVPKLVD